MQRGGGTAALPGPGVRSFGPSRRGEAGEGRVLAERKSRSGGHRRQDRPPAVYDHCPVPCHAGLLAPGNRGRFLRRGLPPPGAVPPDRPGGGVRRAALPVGAGDATGGQHEQGAAVGDPQSPRGLPGPLVPGTRAAPQRRGEPAGGAVRAGGRGGGGCLAGRDQRARPDPGAARPAGAGQRRNPGTRNPLHRIRAKRRHPL